MNPATTQLFDLDSTVMGATVPVAVVLPPDFQQQDESLPLLINLHGGDGDRGFLVAGLPHFQSMWETGELPPLVMVTFSSGGTSWYVGNWEKFVVHELPTYMNTRFNTRLDRKGTVLTGSSMGGYGALKIGFKYPERFSAIASLEAAIEPWFSRTPGNRRNTWFRMEAIESRIWGSPVDEAAWEEDNPATIAYRNADAIRASGLDIYLEVGDQDYLNLHDGNEFLHRVLWDHDIRHEYHLVRWADHVGFSMERRAREVHQFLAASLAGGLEEPADLPLTEDEQAYINWATSGDMAAGEPPPTQEDLMADIARGPSLLRGIFGPSRDRASDDPDLQRAYARLPSTSFMKLSAHSTDGANPRPTLVLKGQAAEMTFDLGGGSIADFHLGEDGINPLAWDSWMFAPDPDAEPPMKPRPFGHFLCLDRWGSASAAEKANGMTNHGEAGSVWWEITREPVFENGVIETSMAASLPTAGMRVERRIKLLDAEAVFLTTESITNDNAIGRIYNIVQHPSIAGAFLDEKTVVDCNGTIGFTQHETLPNLQERVVRWPNALNDQDQSVDIRFLGEDTEPEVASYVVEDEYGWVTAVSPSTGLLFGYLWKSDEFPWVNLWRNAKDGRPFARGLEFGTSGLHRPGHDLIATGKIFDKAIYRYIDAQETQTFRYVSFLVNIPSGYPGVASVNYDGKTITIEESGGKGRTLSLTASDLF